jgi:TonB family protein
MVNYRSRNRRASKGGMAFILSTVALCGLWSGIARAAQTYETSGEERKVISRVDPEYPDALKRLYIGGVVRVEVQVTPNGTVKTTKLLGGSPILGQSTMKAIKQWKYAPAATETILTVKVEFDPHR